MIEPGSSVLVRYPDDDQPSLWQERVLLARLDDLVWVASSPDYELCEVDLSTEEYVRLGRRRGLPRGIREEDCYLFYEENGPWGFLTKAEMAELLERGRVYAERARGGAGLGAAAAAAAPAGGGGATPRASGSLPRASASSVAPLPASSAAAAIPAGVKWVALESVGEISKGDVVSAPKPEVSIGIRGLSQSAHGTVVCARLMTGEEARDLMGEDAARGPGIDSGPAAGDARTLPVMTTALGRHREFSSLAELSEEEVMDDFPLQGPRTASWCLSFLRKRHSPTDHHLFFKTAARLPADAWGMGEHEQLLKMVEMGGCYDQLDLTNLAWAEAAFRRIQVIEWVHHEKLRDVESAGSHDRLSPEEWAAFSGMTRAGDSLMVCPLLLTHVKSVVETDAQIMKSVRKAREERELRRGRAKGKPKGSGE